MSTEYRQDPTAVYEFVVCRLFRDIQAYIRECNQLWQTHPLQIIKRWSEDVGEIEIDVTIRVYDQVTEKAIQQICGLLPSSHSSSGIPLYNITRDNLQKWTRLLHIADTVVKQVFADGASPMKINIEVGAVELWKLAAGLQARKRLERNGEQ